MTYDQRRDYARLLYTRHDIHISDIALDVHVAEAEVRKWINEGAWDAQKRTLLTSKSSLLENLYTALEQLSGKIAGADDVSLKDVDLFVKYTNAVKNLETGVPLSNIIEVSAHFITWLRRRDAELARQVSLHIDAFIKHRSAPSV